MVDCLCSGIQLGPHKAAPCQETGESVKPPSRREAWLISFRDLKGPNILACSPPDGIFCVLGIHLVIDASGKLCTQPLYVLGV